MVNAGYITSVSIHIFNMTGNPGSWRADIYSDDGAHKPLALLVSSAVKTQASTVTNAYNNLVFNTPYFFAAGARFHVVFRLITSPAGRIVTAQALRIPTNIRTIHPGTQRTAAVRGLTTMRWDTILVQSLQPRPQYDRQRQKPDRGKNLQVKS